MRPRKRRRPNWPFRLALLALLAAISLYVAVQTLIGGMTFAYRPYGIDWGLAFVSSLLDATIAVWFIAVGASVGSFLNVVAFRLPLSRSIGGHSSCPFCKTPIDSLDNIPVLGWVKLRGRCRTCRLPISIQYPLVELGVAIVFFVVYVSEFLFSGGNLPGVQGTSIGIGGLMRISVATVVMLRLIVYLIALSGLIGAALIAVRGKGVPFRLYFWSALPLTLAVLLYPSVLVISWRYAEQIGLVDSRLDGLTTLLCGAAAGMAIARLIAPIIYRGFDSRLIASDSPTRGARQFMGAMAVGGALVGWQSTIPLIWFVLVSGLLAGYLLRPYLRVISISDLTVWVWLGLMLFRIVWKPLYTISLFPDVIPVVVQYVLGALMLAPVALVYRYVTTPDDSTSAALLNQADWDADEEELAPPVESKLSDGVEIE